MDSRRSIQLQKIATWRTQRGGTRGGFSRAQGQGFRTAPQSRGPIHGSAGHTGPPDPFHRQQRQRQGLLPAPTIHRGKSPCLMHVSRSHPGGKWTALNPKTMVIMKTWHIQQIDSNPALLKMLKICGRCLHSSIHPSQDWSDWEPGAWFWSGFHEKRE